jgi:phosphoribosylanthranilate isomerase
MAVAVKICGINSAEAARAAEAAGADLAGFVFYPRSPRNVSAEQAREIGRAFSERVMRVALFVDADDEAIQSVLDIADFDMLQLHGGETPARATEIRERFGLPVMKAVKLAGPEDLEEAKAYFEAADRLLFDAKPPTSMKNALPGGNALAFDWELLRGFSAPLPWMLSGGLNPENVAEAIRVSGARAVDVSSGVEDRPGHKDAGLIARFIRAAKGEE